MIKVFQIIHNFEKKSTPLSSFYFDIICEVQIFCRLKEGVNILETAVTTDPQNTQVSHEAIHFFCIEATMLVVIYI